jgi:glucose-6-phosphate dehydrogenase assembly protein OpcA
MEKPVSALVSRACSPAAIDEELAALWRDAGRDGPVARALMANLVIFRDCPARERVDLSAPLEEVPVAEVARRHPSRVILLYHGGQKDLRSPNEATISVLLFGDPPMRFGVEQIAIRSSCAEASLPSIVRRLALGDIPTSIWWTEDLARATPLHSLVTMGRQLLYDSRHWRDVKAGVLALAPLLDRADAPDLADLNWRRLAPMQQAIAEALKAADTAAPRGSLRVRIQHRPGDAALAWLLAGWFCSRLEWPAQDWPAVIDEGRLGDEVLAVAFGDDDPGEATATMNDSRVLVNYRKRSAPFSMAVPRQTDAEGVAAELRNLGFDVALRDTLVALARRFNSSST